MSEPSNTVNFAGNDYLGLARSPRLVEAAHRAATQLGISATSSRWGLGWTEVHEQLESELTDFLRYEATCLLNHGFVGGLVYWRTCNDVQHCLKAHRSCLIKWCNIEKSNPVQHCNIALDFNETDTGEFGEKGMLGETGAVVWLTRWAVAFYVTGLRVFRRRETRWCVFYLAGSLDGGS